MLKGIATILIMLLTGSAFASEDSLRLLTQPAVARVPASDLYSVASGDTVPAGRRANSSHPRGRERLAAPEVNIVHAIIPAPAYLTTGTGSFNLRTAGSIVVQQQHHQHRGVAELLAQSIGELRGKNIPIVTNSGKQNNIVFRLLDTDSSLRSEGYRLSVSSGNILIEAAQPAGWFYAVQTLLQLLPVKATARESLRIAAVTIHDSPRFEWRGLMLDVSRHFFSKEVIKNYLDQMSKYKFNVFHWHLTDNQGWRLEIKSMPNLTKTGAWRVPRTGYWRGFKGPQPGEAATDGGYYTQEDVKEILAYAAQRFITVVPEIDVPGHSLALIASYPEMSCTKTPQQVLAGDPWNPGRTNVLCAGNDSTYAALDKIFGEVAALFPSRYIHIGGDEVSRQYWEKCEVCQHRIKTEKLNNTSELQTYFLNCLARIIESKGKLPMSWYDKLDGGLVSGVAYMSWKDHKGGILASQNGHKAVMTPAFFTYLDFYQNDPVFENGPFTVTRLNTAYAFEPVAAGAKEENILGGQGSLFTEQVPNERKVQYMTWPRGMALSEALWSRKDKRNWDDFVVRMEKHFPRFHHAKVNYATGFYEPIISAKRNADSSYSIIIDTEIKGLDVFYTFDDTNVDEFYPMYKGRPLTIPTGAHHIRARSYRNGQPLGREINLELADLIKRAR
jgi:hexosaminidase